jgi:hypothetical protein
MQEGYDPEIFNRLYKVCKPVIRNLTKQIDCKRFNLTPDIINSYFWDKMIFVFNKYYGTCSENHLQARILSALHTFKNKLLRSAYGEMAEYNQNLAKLEDLFDNSKEDTSDYDLGLEEENNKAKQGMLEAIIEYMKKNMTFDSFRVFEVTYKHPPYIQERINSERSGRLTNMILLDFFDLPHTTEANRYISACRKDVEYWMGRAKKDLSNFSIDEN